MSCFKENFICDQTTYECIIWCEMQTTLKTEQAPISIAKPFFHVRSHTLASKCPEHVACALYPPIPSAGPLLSDDCVFFCMSSRYFICQILFQHDRHDITSVSDITSTCWTTMRKHSTWQVIKMLNPGASCIYDGWMYVYLIFLFLFDRRSMHEIRLYQSKLLPTGEYFRVPLNVLEEEQKPMAMPRAMKKWNMYPSQSKGQESRNKITCFAHCFREVLTFDGLKA